MDFLQNTHGEPTGVEYGFLRAIEMLIKKYPEQDVVVCWDSPTNERRKEDPRYKANRSHKAGSEFFERLKRLRRFLRCYWSECEVHGREADDVMGALASTGSGHRIYTNDSDLLRVVNDSRDVKVVKSFQSKLFEWDETCVVKTYGVTPSLLTWFRAIVGDKSDNLDGAPRVSRTYLASLLSWLDASVPVSVPGWKQEILSGDWKPKELDAIKTHLESGKFDMNFQLMSLRCIDVADLKVTAHVYDELFIVECLKRWEIKSLQLCKPLADKLTVEIEGEEF
jgi:5'-3' exonuclease